MSPEVRRRLRDVLRTIEEVEVYLPEEVPFSEFTGDGLRIRGIERCLSIIGEAINHARKADPNIKITSISQIVLFRNRLVHDYESISVSGLYVVVRKNVPVLKEEVEGLLGSIR